MRENELKYYFPYSVEKEYNFRGLRDNKKLLDRFQPEYEKVFEDGQYVSKIKDFEQNQKKLTENKYILSLFYNWKSWFESGQNIFSFSNELLKMLDKTDVNDLTYQSFKFPYDNFYISLKSMNLKISDDTDKIIEGVYVSIDRQAMENSFNEENPLIFDLAIGFEFVGDFKELQLKFYDKIWDSYGDGIGGVNFWNYAFYFIKKENIITIKDAIIDTKEMFKSSYFPEKDSEVEDIHLDAYNYYIKFIEKTSKVLVNCLLYLSMPKESKDINIKYPTDLPHNYNKKLDFSKNKKDKDKIEQKITRTGFSKIQYVGYSYQKNRLTSKKGDNEVSAHWRRGHWRNQLFGIKLKNNKLIWIKPTMVNKENGNPQKGHVYEVKTNANKV